MKVVVIGGTGLIGSKVVARLKRAGHEALAAAPSTGVDTLTGQGVDAALRGAAVVVDVVNSPSFEPSHVMAFFTAHEKTLLAAEARAGVRHHVALSIVGAERSPEIGYFRAKVAQEALIKASGVPYTIVRATQFMEFLGAIADAGQGDDGEVRISTSLFQPIAAEDVARIVADVATMAPRDGAFDSAGPERAAFSEIVARYLRLTGDGRTVRADPEARYYGGAIERLSLVPTGDALIGEITLADWVSRQSAPSTTVPAGG